MLSAEALTALDGDGRTAVDKEAEGEEVTPHALLVRTLEGANTNPCSFPFPIGVLGFEYIPVIVSRGGCGCVQ